MANSPSQKWENGVLVERAIESNRWKIHADGSPVEDGTEAEPEMKTKAKAVKPAAAENKSIKQASKK